MKVAVAALVALIVGLGLGALLFGNGEPPPAKIVQQPCAEARNEPPPASPLGSPLPVRIASIDSGSTAAEKCTSAEQAVQQLQTQVVELNSKLMTVQAKLEATEKDRAEREGAAIPKPPNLAPRFEQEPMRIAVEKALKEAGFKDATVTSVDCTEYPCVVYGTGMGSREDMQKLDKVPAMDPYDNDNRSGWGWSTRGADGGYLRSFGIAYLPKDATSTNDVFKRLQFRVDEFQKAGR
ncbi:MAG: hypothetical protein ACJ790_20615 [Myxococcaceae bacterium]